MESRTFRYDKWSHRLGYSCLPLVLLAGASLASITFIVGIVGDQGGLNRNFFDWICPQVIFLLMGVGALGIHVSNPTIEVTESQFRLKTLLYKSHWFSWDKITEISEPIAPKSKGRKIYAIGVEGISPLFLLAGFNAQLFDRGFIVTSEIQDFDSLMSLIQEKRPDLFEK